MRPLYDAQYEITDKTIIRIVDGINRRVKKYIAYCERHGYDLTHAQHFLEDGIDIHFIDALLKVVEREGGTHDALHMPR